LDYFLFADHPGVCAGINAVLDIDDHIVSPLRADGTIAAGVA